MSERKYVNLKDKQFTTSKIWLIVTGFIFIVTLVSTFILMGFTQNVYDTSIFITMITVTGAIFGSNLVWYSKKSASENHYKLRISMYEDAVNQRLYFNEEMMKLKKKYDMTDDDIQDINDSGDIDEAMESELQSLGGKLDSDRDECESPNEIENFSI